MIMGKIERAQASVVEYKLDQAVGGSGVAAVDLIVVELTDSDGATGLGFSYVLGGGGDLALRAAEAQLARFVRSQTLAPPRAQWKKIAQSFNRTGLGPNLIGLAAVDVACWDLHARRMNVPLGVAMGGQIRATPVYGSGGFNVVQSASEAASVAEAQAQRGLSAVKPRVAGIKKDADVLSAVRKAVGERTHIMADANEKCDLASAQWLMALARDHGLLFVEEPLPASALSGYRMLRNTGVAIATGEHLQSLRDFTGLISEGIVSVVQPDLAMIGGLTPSLDLAIVAEAFDVSVSPHFLPGLFAHLAAASSAVRWLEEFPLLEPLFDGWPEIAKDGTMSASAAPGHGLVLTSKARGMLRD
jgi:L-alanine-DL-glutamate epimerase-like enolase superfamily enzyme